MPPMMSVVASDHLCQAVSPLWVHSAVTAAADVRRQSGQNTSRTMTLPLTWGEGATRTRQGPWRCRWHEERERPEHVKDHDAAADTRRQSGENTSRTIWRCRHQTSPSLMIGGNVKLMIGGINSMKKSGTILRGQREGGCEILPKMCCTVIANLAFFTNCYHTIFFIFILKCFFWVIFKLLNFVL